MATFLQLCQAVASESGTVDNPAVQLPTVVGQSKRLGKIVRWTNTAWRQIQNAHSTWLWMQAEFEGPTVAHQQRYEYAEFEDVGTSAAIDRFAEWVYQPARVDTGFTIYDATIGRRDEGHLRFQSWDDFYRSRLRGEQLEGKPNLFSVDPQNRIVLSRTPDSANYVLRGRYRKDVQNLLLDTDAPEMPARFHDVIVDVAMMMLETHDESPSRIPLIQMRKSALFMNLERDQIPPIRFAGPLA